MSNHLQSSEASAATAPHFSRRFGRLILRLWLPRAALLLLSTGVTPALAGAFPEFAPSVDYPVGGLSTGLALGLFDNDPFPDFVTANQETRDLSVRFNLGDGTFGPEMRLPAIGSFPHRIATGDLNGDGFDDIVTIFRFSSVGIEVTMSNGDGTFAAPVPYGGKTISFSINLADYDGDNDLDVAVVRPMFHESGLNAAVNLYRNNGDGTLAPPETSFTVGVDGGGIIYIADFATSDIDSDGDLDIVTAIANNGRYGKILNNGNGTFGPVEELGFPESTPIAIHLEDIDGDGDPDLIVSDVETEPGNMMNIFTNDGAGNFAFDQSIEVIEQTHSFVFSNPLASFDLNADTNPDIIITGSLVNQLQILNNTGVTLLPQSPITLGTRPYAIDVGDLDLDGDPDIVAVNTGEIIGLGSVSVLMNLSDPVFSLGDCDSDGDVDLVDFAAFQLCFTGPGGDGGPDCFCADLDADNDVDLVDFAAFQLALTGPL